MYGSGDNYNGYDDDVDGWDDDDNSHYDNRLNGDGAAQQHGQCFFTCTKAQLKYRSHSTSVGDIMNKLSTLCLKKVPTFKLSVTLSNLNRFSKILHSGKRMKFATKPIRHYPPHLKHVVALPWEIENSNFLQIFSRHGRKCKQVAFLSPLALLLIHKF